MINKTSYIYTKLSTDINWQQNGFNYEYILKQNDLHVWKINVQKYFSSLFKEHGHILNEHEINKAKKFYWEHKLNSFLTGRIILRTLLSRHLKIPANEIQFNLEVKKPAIISNNPIMFNLSYSDKYILISMALCETGIDIEEIKQSFDYSEIVTSCFSEKEIEFIKNKQEKREDFFLQWTRKEALLKYTGQGIINNLTTIPSLDGNHSSQGSPLKLKENINLTSFILDTNYAGSFAYPTYISNIKYLEW